MTSGLIDKLRAATEGGRELDAEICLILEPDSSIGKHCADDAEPTWYSRDGKRRIPRFTTSLDAALTLAPEGWSLYRLNQYHNHDNPAWGWGALLRCHTTRRVGMMVGESTADPALALCIAALMVREWRP